MIKNDEILMSPKDRYIKKYLGELKKSNEDLYNNIILYSTIQEDFIKHIVSLGFKPVGYDSNITYLRLRLNEKNEFIIWLRNFVDIKYQYSPYDKFDISLITNEPCYKELISLKNIPLTKKSVIGEIIKMAKDFYNF